MTNFNTYCHALQIIDLTKYLFDWFTYFYRKMRLQITNTSIQTSNYEQKSKKSQVLGLRIKMPQSSQDYKGLYQTKCIQFEQLSQQFNELQQQSTLIMNDLQDEIKELKRRNEMLERQIKDLKQKKKYFASTIQRELQVAQKQKNQFKSRFKQFQKKVIQLQIINQDLQNQLRATRSTLQQYQLSAQRTMQQLAILRVQLQESTSSKQEQIARLMQQLKETEEEMVIMCQRGKGNERGVEGGGKERRDETPRSMKRVGEGGNGGGEVGLQVGISSQLGMHTPSQTTPHLTPNMTPYISPQHITPAHQIMHKKQSFRQTIKSMRNYMEKIDKKMQQRRKILLNYHKEVLRV